LHSEIQNGAIAQSVEQRTENPCVGGSIPSRTTFEKEGFCLPFFCFEPVGGIIYQQQSKKSGLLHLSKQRSGMLLITITKPEITSTLLITITQA
jgi:hypothetical protein